MKKSIFAVLMASVMLLCTACGPNSTSSSAKDSSSTTKSDALKAIKKEDLKVGFVYIGTINDEGYTQAQDKGRLALEEMGIKTMYSESVPENSDCETAIRNLIDQGCNVIYSTSFGFGEWTAKVAKDNPGVYFGHCSGSTRLDNMSTYFGKMIEGRYLAGIVAGKNSASGKIGYVAAMPIPEVIRGINAFTLGAKSVNPDATVEVVWTNTWFDPSVEKQAALELLNKGCDLIAQHQDSTAAQIAAQEKGALAIGYNTPTPNAAPDAYLTAPLFHWEKFIVDDVQKIMDGTWTSRAYWEGLSSGMVSLDTLSSKCKDGTQPLVDDAQAKIISGDLKIFKGPIKDQNGEVTVADGSEMTDDEIWSMSWFVEGVIGTIPKG